MCRDIPGQCAKSQVPPTNPTNASIPDPLPRPSLTDVVKLVAMESSAAQCKVDTTSGPGANCPLEQECRDVNLLAHGGADATELRLSTVYTAAFGILSGKSFALSAQTLIDEFNSQSTIQSASTFFSELNDRELQVTQADGSVVFDFFLPTVQAPGQPRTLENSQVDVTLPYLETLGDLRLRYFFDTGGHVDTVERFIRPPNQATDRFFPFPLKQTVSVRTDGECTIVSL